MKLHPRYRLTSKAETEFQDFYIAWLTNNSELTMAEFMEILLVVTFNLNQRVINREHNLSSEDTGSEG